MGNSTSKRYIFLGRLLYNLPASLSCYGVFEMASRDTGMEAMMKGMLGSDLGGSGSFSNSGGNGEGYSWGGNMVVGIGEDIVRSAGKNAVDATSQNINSAVREGVNSLFNSIFK